jgi:hypothetical protein
MEYKIGDKISFTMHRTTRYGVITEVHEPVNYLPVMYFVQVDEIPGFFVVYGFEIDGLWGVSR